MMTKRTTAIEAMNGSDLGGRALKVNEVALAKTVLSPVQLVSFLSFRKFSFTEARLQRRVFFVKSIQVRVLLKFLFP